MATGYGTSPYLYGSGQYGNAGVSTRSPSDAFTTADTYTPTSTRTRNVTDAFTTAETISAVVVKASEAYGNGPYVYGSGQYGAPGTSTRSPSDTFSITDAITRQDTTRPRQLADSVRTADTYVISATRVRTIVDRNTSADNASRVLAQVRQIVDSFALNELTGVVNTFGAMTVATAPSSTMTVATATTATMIAATATTATMIGA